MAVLPMPMSDRPPEFVWSTVLSRRRLLQAATALAVKVSMPAVLGRAAAQAGNSDNLPLRGGEILPDPNFSLLRPKDAYLIGIRPHREGGVRLELEQEPIASRSGPKFLIHNYGHGGAGITLSFGCASVVADHVRTLLRASRWGSDPSGAPAIGLIAWRRRRFRFESGAAHYPG